MFSGMGNNGIDANCLNACDTPLFTGGPVGYPCGTVFVCLGAYPATGYGTPYPLYIVR